MSQYLSDFESLLLVNIEIVFRTINLSKALNFESLVSYLQIIEWTSYLKATTAHFRSPKSIPPALSENLLRINVYLDCKPILEVQFLNDDNSGVIGSVP